MSRPSPWFQGRGPEGSLNTDALKSGGFRKTKRNPIADLDLVAPLAFHFRTDLVCLKLLEVAVVRERDSNPRRFTTVLFPADGSSSCSAVPAERNGKAVEANFYSGAMTRPKSGTNARFERVSL